MKLLKLILLTVVLLVSVGMLAGCEAGYARRPSGEFGKTYHQRADSLRIPSYSYQR